MFLFPGSYTLSAPERKQRPQAQAITSPSAVPRNAAGSIGLPSGELDRLQHRIQLLTAGEEPSCFRRPEPHRSRMRTADEARARARCGHPGLHPLRTCRCPQQVHPAADQRSSPAVDHRKPRRHSRPWKKGRCLQGPSLGRNRPRRAAARPGRTTIDDVDARSAVGKRTRASCRTRTFASESGLAQPRSISPGAAAGWRDFGCSPRNPEGNAFREPSKSGRPLPWHMPRAYELPSPSPNGGYPAPFAPVF